MATNRMEQSHPSHGDGYCEPEENRSHVWSKPWRRYPLLTFEQQEDARGWLMDCFPDSEDYIADEATPYEITMAVVRHYDGGIGQFLVDGNYVDRGREL